MTQPQSPDSRRWRLGRRLPPLMERPAYRGMSADEAEAAHAAQRNRFGVLLAVFMTQFFGMISNTIIGNAMPVIVSQIGGTQGQYAWVLTGGILANTITTPIAGKLADLVSKKALFLAGIGLFMFGSLLCGLAWSPEILIAFRVFQGMGMGIQVTLSQVILASVVPPRERGRYNGIMGAIFATATVAGPLVGGVIVDTPFLGWRWTYWIVLPFMAIALVVTAQRLHLPRDRSRKVRIDYLGALFISSAAALVLLWMSEVGRSFDPLSWPSATLLGTALVCALLFGLVEARVLEPLIPLQILLSRSTMMAIIASVSIGTAMFGANVYLGQYFQYGLGYSPTIAGLLGLPMIFGIVLASTLTGRWITRRSTWKEFVAGGMALLALGFLAFGLVGGATPLWITMGLLFLGGLGLGASNQNLILAVQNTVGLANIGAATSAITFFRTLFGAIGIQLMGLVYGIAVEAGVASRLGADVAQRIAGSGSSLRFDALDPATEASVRLAYADAIGPTFGVVGLLALGGMIAVLLMPNTRLRDTVDTPSREGSRGPSLG